MPVVRALSVAVNEVPWSTDLRSIGRVDAGRVGKRQNVRHDPFGVPSNRFQPCQLDADTGADSTICALTPSWVSLSHPLSLREARSAASYIRTIMNKMNPKPAGEEPEPGVPTDLRKALTAAPLAKAQWRDLTPIARRDFISWLDSAKQPETRRRRIEKAC